ncbi:flavodoxin family protein [Pseudonocardia petroleophila]|uniref:Flavodoxin family protein n=1 Tax=Pseudonocardia petroleophila TaxID=37331 RepID=A0A7G7MF13_9PSEU|nr:flavodoxin family protein [Pseudonocardia petroleophila]QNG51374.1 flavodoxin family protein [Pseudonocardia petroleophila]
MDALVVVESMFGNTRRIAEAVALGLGDRVHARVLEVGDPEAARAAAVADLLVVGGPTHAFGMSRPATRRSAAEQGAPAVEVGLREWLADLAPAGPGRTAAAFDTRADRPRLPGSAASAAARRLRRSGYAVVARPASFRVTGTTGPLVAGEEERARVWGVNLVARLVLRAADRG